MIGVKRSDEPLHLAQKGKALTQEAIDAVEEAIASGEKPGYSWKPKDYAHADVRSVLGAMFHGKCAYCESPIEHVAFPEVEHYRPKKSVAGEPEHPGYYWLGYEWSNLLLACTQCNRGRGGKHTVFPISRQRAVSPADNLALEQPDLLDPTCDRPEDHLQYDLTSGHLIARNGSKRGTATIRVCNLHKQDLRARQMGHIEFLIGLKARRDLAELRGDSAGKVEIHQKILDAQKGSAPYAALARQFFEEMRKPSPDRGPGR